MNKNNADLTARRGERGNTMKLNKTLAQMREANAEGGAVTIYGAEAYHRIYNFKAIKAADVDCNGVITFVLNDNTEITAYYAE